MHRLGVNGKMLRIVRAVYEHVRFRTRHCSTYSDFMDVDDGLEQCEICSPFPKNVPTPCGNLTESYEISDGRYGDLDNYEETIRDLTNRLKDAEYRATEAERVVSKLQKEVNRLEDELLAEKEKFKAISDELVKTLHEVAGKMNNLVICIVVLSAIVGYASADQFCCNSFAICVDGQYSIFDCSGNMTYNKETGICDDPKNVPPPCGSLIDYTESPDGLNDILGSFEATIHECTQRLKIAEDRVSNAERVIIKLQKEVDRLADELLAEKLKYSDELEQMISELA
ncbi:tropomyosin-like [Mercenaria mercenaria]|uniref:tropomyosin-like n=1 Tax=Mercenaria mercenaria TaxID=6596 RepID=UPI00234E56FF|nr:tropomyosin-like [Mercenaria mercenaria]